MEPGTASAAHEWAQTGGTAAFAGIVLYLLFQLRPILSAVLKVLGEIRELLAALLERERARAERIAAQDAARRQQQTDETWEDENTNPIAVAVKAQRPRTNPGGVPIGQYSLKPPRNG